MSNLEVIVKESGLEGTKAQYVLDNFKSYFELAAEWEKKAKTIVVTRADQKADMQMARIGRLELREKRIALENSRKKLKEDVIREGKAIDGISNVLKALIEPIEEYLDEQEHFVEREQERKDAALRAEIEQRMADEQALRDKEEAEKAEKLRLENERLKKEAAAREAEITKEREAEKAKAEAERKKQEEALAAERKKTEEAKAKADAEKKAAEEKVRAEKENAEAEKKKAEAEAAKKLEAERLEKERLQKLLDAQVECPKCKHTFVPEKKIC